MRSRILSSSLIVLSLSVVLLGQRPGAVPASAPQSPPPAPVAAAGPTPFTIDRVLEQLAGTHKNASRVSDELPAGVRAIENVTYATPGGVELQLDVYQPPGSGPSPAVLLVHGGGWESGSRQMERPFAKQLAGLGYVTLPVSYRLGAPGRFPSAIHDLKAAVRWVRSNAKRYAIDPDRIGVVGGSAGGQLAALLGASNGVAILEGESGSAGTASTVQAVVDIDGAVSFPDAALIAQEEIEHKATSRFLGGNYTERAGAWFAASPITHVGRSSAPTLFINSTVDRPILPGRDEMSARLRALGIASHVVVLPGAPHPFWLVHPWFERVLQETDAFLRRQLKGAPPAMTEWVVDNLTSIGGHAVTAIGTPSVVSTPAGPAVEFDGASDGLLVSANPLEGLGQFTMEVLFATDPDGGAEQRFVHVQEAPGDNRALMEMRLLDAGRWCLDTFLKHGTAARTLIDRGLAHPPTTWHVASLVFDGREMSHYVDGVRELFGNVGFQPLGPGSTSIGVRMNRVSWFKGRIARLRVTPYPLTPREMMRAPR